MATDRRAPSARRTDRLIVVGALLAYGLGAAARLHYALVAHRPAHNVISDVTNMVEGAYRMLGGAQGRWDTVWPPGQMAFLALSSRLDPTLGLATAVQLGLSLLVPWLAASVAGQLSSRRGYWFGLAAASLHVGYVHHVGFFLSEPLFQVATALAIWATTTVIRAGAAPLARPAQGWRLGLGAGALWGLGALFRPNALPILLIVGAATLALALFTRAKALRSVAFALLCGAAVALTPMIHRCTLLKGELCPVSCNFAMNVALGQAGEKEGLTFSALGRPDGSKWTPPALLDHHYRGHDHVPATIFDTTEILQWVRERVAQDPVRALGYAVRNATDTFRPNVWPEVYGSWPVAIFSVGAWVFAAAVLLPGLWGAARVLRGVRWRARLRREAAAFVAVAGVLGVLLLAGISLGEARYRYPFDLWWIALAARAFSAPKRRPIELRARRLVALGTAGGTMALVLLMLVAHPRTSLAARLVPPSFARSGPRLELPAAELARRRPEGARWDDRTAVLPCDPSCMELRVSWPAPQRGTTLRIASDRNDAYWVELRRAGKPLAAFELPLRSLGNGLVEHELAIPAAAQGFDQARIVPLYGDGSYAIGHVIVDQLPLGEDGGAPTTSGEPAG